MNHPSRQPIELLLRACAVKRTRGSGPGGQHRNKVETAIVITHRPTGVVGQASENRSQERNRELAIQRLRVNLALAVRSEREKNAPPSELWQSRIKAKRIQVNVNHSDFPGLLSEALDVVHEFDFDVKCSAENLNVSTSQLIKFIKSCPAADDWVNRQREQRNLKRLA